MSHRPTPRGTLRIVPRRPVDASSPCDHWRCYIVVLKMSQAPLGGGAEIVLKYLARYTHKAAISNHRLVDLADGRVSFQWKDYAHGGRQGIMTLDAVEFVRRFLMHVLPSGFVRVRHYGLLANRHRQEKLARCRELIGAAKTP